MRKRMEYMLAGLVYILFVAACFIGAALGGFDGWF